MTRRTLILGTAGHIDHGKTSLIRALTGIDADRLPEEKQRGMTIDIGFAHLDLGDFQLGIVDVPGHERFVKNMLAGAAGIDMALMIVAADDSVMPQSREHLAILQLLGISHGVVVITKCDRVEPDWLDVVRDDIRSLVNGTFLECAPVVRTAVSKEFPPRGLDELKHAIQSQCQQIAARTPSGLFRLPIDRAFTVEGIGTVVTGTVWAGQLTPREAVELLPSRQAINVRAVQNHGRDAETVVQGQRAAVNLAGARTSEICRGNEIAIPGYLCPTKLMTVDLHVLKDSRWSIKHRSRQRLYLGTQEIHVTVALLDEATIDVGGYGLAQLYCATPAVATAGQPFVIRAESPLCTMGGGRVLQPVAKKIKRRQHALIDRLRMLDSPDEIARAATAIYFFGIRKWTELDLCRDAHISRARYTTIVDQLRQVGTIVPLETKSRDTFLVHKEVLEEKEAQLLVVIEHFHDHAPLRPTIPREQIVGAFAAAAEPLVTHALLDKMVGEGCLRANPTSVALIDFSPQISTTHAALQQQILAQLREGGLKPPDISELCLATNANRDDVRKLLELSAFEGKAVRLDDNLFLDQRIEESIRQRLIHELQQSSALTVSQIRDVLGTSRKFAVPICEYYDRIGLTLRHGDLRSLRS